MMKGVSVMENKITLETLMNRKDSDGLDNVKHESSVSPIQGNKLSAKQQARVEDLKKSIDLMDSQTIY